jgi:outer membrane receptor protein involved in Fe transport
MANPRIARAVRVALMTAGAASVGLYGASASAQDVPDEITVTGSRIAKRDAIAESPIYTVDQDALTHSGYVTVDQYLNTLPQIVPSVSSQSNNPSSNGRAFVDLRGLGATRNIVMIDGRRAMGQASGGTIVDINTIPAALVDRVEIISGGAAATYGPDAVAGVVNFIMKHSFDGFAIDGQYRITEEGDGEEWNSDLTFGGDFADGRGTSVFNFNYFKRQAMYKDARAFAAQASSLTGIFPGGGYSAGTNTPSQAAVDAIFGPDTCNTNGGSSGFGFNPDGSLFCTGVSGDPTRNAAGFAGPDDWIATAFYPDRFSYNFEPDNILVLPQERWGFYTHVDLELSDHFKPYVQAMFTNYNALQELAPTPGGGFVLPVTNPFIPDQLASLLATRADPTADFTMSKRFNALGGRTGFNTHDVWQTVVGATGDIVGSWQYDVYGSWGRSVLNELQGGNVRVPETFELLEAEDGGASICAGGLNFFGTGPISQECQDYISLEAKNLTVSEMGVLEGVVTGDLFELPAGTVQSAFGASYRHMDFQFKPDSGLKPGIVVGFNEQLPIAGTLWYTDVFAEVSVPLLSDLPFAQSLSTTLGVRTTDNNSFGSDETWKATLDWTMTDAVRFRGGLQHAIRSPNIAELFAPQTNNFPNFSDSDPCNTTGPNADNPEFGRNGPNGAQVQALCAQQAAVAGGPSFFQPFGQAQAIGGGNPDLKPEQADSWSAGFVVTPAFENPMLEQFSFSIDYFEIELEDVIAAVGATTIIQRCYNREGANPTYDINNEWCQLYTRDQSDGRVIGLQQFQRNQAFLTVSGIDLTMNWGIPVGPGDLGFAVLATWTEKNEQQVSIADPVNDFAGTISQTTGTSSPEWRGTLLTTYSVGDLEFRATTRYIGSMVHANTVTGGSPDTNTGVDSTWYLDLMARYDVTENLSLRAGINNAANQKPRLYSPNVQANTDPSLYDVLGRRFFAGFNWRM